MDKKTALKLRKGNRIYWTDPDEDMTSRYLIIQEITIVDDMFKITTTDKDYLEGFIWELSARGWKIESY